MEKRAISFTRSLISVLLLCSACRGNAQATNVTDMEATPIPEAGHNYIEGLSETVNPANGSLSVRLTVPMPNARGLTVPFSINYDSNGAIPLPGSYNYQDFFLMGWSYGLPVVNVQSTFVHKQFEGDPETCGYFAGYVLTDAQGTRHAFPQLAYVEGGTQPTGCTANGISMQPAGNDPYMSAKLQTGVLQVQDADGTLYTASPTGGIVSSIEDRNGNIVNFAASSGNFTETDTSGRTVLSSSGSIGSSSTVTVSGLPAPYTLQWNKTATWNYPSSVKLVYVPSGGTVTCSGYNAPLPTSGSNPVVGTLTLPNGQSYTFSYDPTYGLLNQITYPDGGWVKYSWTLNTSTESAAQGETLANGAPTACGWRLGTPQITDRQVSFNGSTINQEQVFSYNTAWEDNNNDYTATEWSSKTTTVTTTDNVRGYTSKTVYNYSSTGQPAVAYATSYIGGQIPVENQIFYYDWNGSLLRTVAKTWYNQYLLQNEQVTESNGQTSRTAYTYGNLGVLTEKDEYDYGQSSATRKTVLAYQNLPTNPLGASIYDRPCQVRVLDGSGNRLSEVDYFYDNEAIGAVCGAAGTPAVAPVSNAPQHDETNFGSSATTARGNLTAKVAWSNLGFSPVTTYAFDETGQVRNATDACGNGACADMSGSTHTVSYAYDPTNTYPNSVTDALGHATDYTYRLADGKLSKVVDPNGQATQYQYGTEASGCSSTDLFDRLTEVDSADGGVTTYCYDDPAATVTTSVLMNPGTKVTVNSLDGLGHVVHSSLASDPAGADTVDTTYDGEGLVFTKSNPHRGASSPTDGTATYYYDALQRPVQTSDQDGSTHQWCYNGLTSVGQANCAGNAGSVAAVTWVDETDEAGNHTQRWSDSFDRLRVVVAPSPTSGSLALETDYVYDGLDNLVGVQQKGVSGETARTRSFTYDSLSRLMCANNPEDSTGACPASATTPTPSTDIGYTYDLNGNLSRKVDARGQSVAYTYDTLNRMLTKSDNGSLTDSYYYDGAVGSGASLSGLGSGVSEVGRLSFARAVLPNANVAAAKQFADDYYGYDPVGRLKHRSMAPPSEWGTTLHSVDATYDVAGDMLTLVYPNGLSVSQSFDAAGRLSSVYPTSASSSPYVSAITYSPVSSPVKIAYGNGVVENFTQNNRLQPCENYAFLPSGAGGSLVFDKQYVYSTTNRSTANVGAPCPNATSNNGNVGYVLDGVNTSTSGVYSRAFTYDHLNRLSSFDVALMGGQHRHQNFTMDSFGNITSMGSTIPPADGSADPLSFSGSYTSANQLAPSSAQCLPFTGTNPPQGTVGQTSVFDASGNLLCSGQQNFNAQAYLWDAEGRFSQLWGEHGNNSYSLTASYSYDAGGERVRSDFFNQATPASFREYSTFNGEAIAEKDQQGLWTNYIYAAGVEIAKVDPSDAPLHISGTNCSNCGGTASYVSLYGGAGHVITTGDVLHFTQYNQTYSVGGLILRFSDGSQTSGLVAQDQNGQQVNCDTTQNTLLERNVDLSSYAGKTLAFTLVINDVCSPAGNFSQYFNDIAILSSSGAVTQIYTPELGLTFTMVKSSAWPGAVTNMRAVAESNANLADPTQQQATHYYLHDNLHTTQLEFASGGWPIWRGEFAPFGQELDGETTVNRYKFTGKERDAESGLDYFGARYNSSSMGRFMSPDPLGGDLTNPQSLNRYSYVLNNPLTNTDPTGMYTCTDSKDCSSKKDQALEKTLAGLRNSKNADVARAANAYGAQNKDNGVSVGFADLSKSGEGGNTVSTIGVAADGSLRANSAITLSSKDGGTDFTADVGHEGSHAADAQDVVKSGLTEDGQAIHAGMNITPYQSEQRAYGVTNSILNSGNESRNYVCGSGGCLLGRGATDVPGTVDRLVGGNAIYNQGGRPMSSTNQGPSVVNGVTPKATVPSVPH